MKNIILKIALTILFVFNHLTFFSQTPSILYDIAGQYPLKCKVVNPDVGYAKYTELGTWDISLNGNHGRVEPLVGSDIGSNQSFDAIEFRGETYLKGIEKGRIYLNKNPFLDNVVSDSFTVAFWIRADAKGRVLRIHSLDITARGTGEIVFVYNDGAAEVALEHLDFSIDSSINDGWVNVAFVYDKSVNSVFIYANDTLKSTISVTSTIRTKYTESYIADYDFEGGLANVSFVRLALDPTTLPQLNDIIINQSAYATRMFRNYPLDGAISSDIVRETVSGKDAISTGGIRSTINRNSEANKAVRFDEGGKIELPYLFGENAKTDVYDELRGVTVSLWVKIESSENTPLSGIGPVIAPNDILNSILYGIDSNMRPLFGLQRVKDRLGNYTYIKDKDTNGNNIKYPWYNWYYDPVGFRNTSGWFHIIYVQHKNWTKTYLAKHNEVAKFDCAVADWDCWRDVQVHFDYNSFQSIEDAVAWGLGSFDSTHKAHVVIDDLSIYRWPMDVEQAVALHNIAETTNNNRIKIKANEIIEEKSLVSKFLIYPNPAINGSFQLEFGIENEGFARVEIVNLVGQLIFKKDYQNLEKGHNTLQFDKNDVVLSSGIYIIKVVTHEFNESNKLIIK